MLTVDYKDIAKTLINESMQIKENDVLWISAGKHNFELAEEAALQARLAGAFPIIEVSSDSLVRRIMEDVPHEFIKKPAHHLAKMWKHIDALLCIEAHKDPSLLDDISSEKKSDARKAGTPSRKVLTERGVKIALVLFPTEEMAKAYNVSWEYYHDRVWGAMQVSPVELLKRGRPLRDILNKGRKVHVTSQKGTDLRFSIEDRGAVICSGQELEENYQVCRYNLNLPAGEVFTTIVEDSAEGTAVFDKVFIGGKAVKNLRLNFENGGVISYDADENKEVFDDFFKNLLSTDKLAAEFGIGINPCIKDVIGCLHTDEKMMGTIHIAIGASNMYGGKNDTPLHFDMIMPSPSFTVDDVLYMESGNILF